MIVGVKPPAGLSRLGFPNSKSRRLIKSIDAIGGFMPYQLCKTYIQLRRTKALIDEKKGGGQLKLNGQANLKIRN